MDEAHRDRDVILSSLCGAGEGTSETGYVERPSSQSFRRVRKQRAYNLMVPDGIALVCGKKIGQGIRQTGGTSSEHDRPTGTSSSSAWKKLRSWWLLVL